MPYTQHGDQQRAKIRAAIADLSRANEYSPTVREIAAEVGLSVSATFNHLKVLRERGEVRAQRRGGWTV